MRTVPPHAPRCHRPLARITFQEPSDGSGYGFLFLRQFGHFRTVPLGHRSRRPLKSLVQMAKIARIGAPRLQVLGDIGNCDRVTTDRFQ